MLFSYRILCTVTFEKDAGRVLPANRRSMRARVLFAGSIPVITVGD